MFSLQNHSLSHHQTPLLTHTPPNLSLHPDPTHAGTFLTLSPATPAPRLTLPLGTPTASRFAAAYRNRPFWMVPAIATTPSQIPMETQALFAQLTPNQIALFIPLLSPTTRCTLEGNPNNQLCLTLDTGNPAISIPPTPLTALFLAVQPPHKNLNAFLARCADAVAQHLHIKLRHQKPLPPFIDHFGWCTWDAFYHEVSHEKIREGLLSFQSLGISPKFLIIDDGWQSTTNLGEIRGKRLSSLSPNEKFSHNFTPTARMAREEFAVQHILAWHTLQGYWGGIDATALPQYHPVETTRDFCPGLLHHWPLANSIHWGRDAGTIPPQHLAQFFDDYHALLKSQGITGVKVDNQATTEALTVTPPLLPQSRVEIYATARAALDASVKKHFTNNILHCMSNANDLLYANDTFPLTRTSNDFWPTKPETHGLHIWTNALVSLWFAHFAHPDWDMFQSHLEGNWSHFHAAARAISGGPIYVSDKPNQHNAPLLKSLIHSDGTIPRCDRPATIAPDSLFQDPLTENTLLKIHNTNRNATTGIIALFNCHYDPQNPTKQITSTFSPNELPEIAGHEKYLVHIHTNNPATIGTPQSGIGVPPMLVATADQQIPITLAQSQYAIATLIPLIHGIAPLGLLEKQNPAATITNIYHSPNSLRLLPHDTGTLALYSEKPPTRVLQNAISLPFTSKDTWTTIPIPQVDETIVLF